ncbi:nucleoside deaminase [Patescibacteria group bacterium]|nr:nucleoside deaminase [Patescibacteria group bacterium]MBU1673146.1 nucleoside deaminase [Patescibacteria group bacterium]MBU1963398.1 nucleoside deaminase [Patescibacteria group bacterium]
MKEQDFMRQAIVEAQEGIKKGNGPFGAVIIQDGQVIAKAHSQVIQDNDPTAHAEVTAIRKASKKLRTHDLSNMTIYSTTEPCPMCFSAIHWANIKIIVYGADIDTAKKYGFNELEISNYKMRSLGKTKVNIEADFMPRECEKLFHDWKESGNEAY